MTPEGHPRTSPVYGGFHHTKSSGIAVGYKDNHLTVKNPVIYGGFFTG